MPRMPLDLGRNFLMSLGGLGLQSGFHFVLNMLLAATLSAYEYGLFAIVFIVGGLALTYGNAAVSVPAAVELPKLKSERSLGAMDIVFSSVAAALSAALALLVAFALWLATQSVALSLMAALFVGLWLLRNHLRMTLFARQAIDRAFYTDLAYALAGSLFIAALYFSTGHMDAATVIGALAAANAVAIVVVLLPIIGNVRVSLRRSVRRRYIRLWPDIAWSLAGTTSWNILGQIPTLLITLLVGAAGFAPIAAALVLFNPLRTALDALLTVVRPKFALQLAHRQYASARSTMWISFATVALVCLCFNAVVFAAWPMLDRLIYAKFHDATLWIVVGFAGLIVLISSTYHVPLALLQAARNYKAVAVATTAGGIVAILATLIAVAIGGVDWALAGLASGETVCWAILWVAGSRVLRGKSPAPVANPTPASLGGAPIEISTR